MNKCAPNIQVVSLSRQSSAKQSRREGSARRKESYGLDYAKLRWGYTWAPVALISPIHLSHPWIFCNFYLLHSPLTRHLQQQWNEVRDLELCQQTLCYVFSTYHDILLAFKKTGIHRNIMKLHTMQHQVLLYIYRTTLFIPSTPVLKQQFKQISLF